MNLQYPKQGICYNCNFGAMKKTVLKFFLFLVLIININMPLFAQCSLCAKTAQQMGEKPALGINNGILYLIFMPFILVGVIGYKWWRNNRDI